MGDQFHSNGGEQNIAQGDHAIGKQIKVTQSVSGDGNLLAGFVKFCCTGKILQFFTKLIKMNGFEINTPRSKIAAMPENERVLFLLLGHLANELSILRKLFFFCGHTESANKWQSRANNAQALVMARVLIGKLWEGWLLLQKCFFDTKLSKEYDSLLSKKEKESLSDLKKYFAKDNLIKNLRNDFSFHYSGEAMKKTFGKTPENETDNWQIYIGDNVGNSLFFVSEYVVNHALF